MAMCLPLSDTGRVWEFVDDDTRDMLLESAAKS